MNRTLESSHFDLPRERVCHARLASPELDPDDIEKVN